MKKERNKKIRILPVEPLPVSVTPEYILKRVHSFEGKFANFIANASGNMWFVYLHGLWFAFWIAANHDAIPGIRPFDPFPYGLLTMVVSLEAIFLSTFILINQNRQVLTDVYRELEDVEEQKEDEEQQEELEEDVEDIQKDLNDIKSAMAFIQNKINHVEKAKEVSGNENGSSPPPATT